MAETIGAETKFGAFALRYCGWLLNVDMSMSSPKLSPARYYLGLQRFTVTFCPHVYWYIIQRWSKREVLKRRWRLQGFNTVDDWGSWIFSHPKISPPRYSFRLQYFAVARRLIYNPMMTKTVELKCRWEAQAFNTVAVRRSIRNYPNINTVLAILSTRATARCLSPAHEPRSQILIAALWKTLIDVGVGPDVTGRRPAGGRSRIDDDDDDGY